MPLPTPADSDEQLEACHFHLKEQAEPAGLAPVEEPEQGNIIRRALRILGPGVITGASDDDPTAIATYSAAGASFGYSTLWTAILTFPMMAAVQYICAKIGMVSGMGLVGALQSHYSRRIIYPAVFALVIANTINAGADVGAIAAGLNLLVPIPIIWMIVPVSGVIVALLILGSYRLISRIFKWVALSLFAYIGAAILGHPDVLATLAGTFLPTISLNPLFLATLVAILGTNLSPYLFFWQTSQEVEEEVKAGKRHLWQRRGASDRDLRWARVDVNTGMAFSNLVIYFINMAAAATLFASGLHSVQSAADAATALRPLAGDFAFVLFAVGMIGSGFLAVPVLAGSAAYAVAELFCWPHSLAEKPSHAWQFYAIIAGAVFVGMVVNFFGINPIAALFWSAALNGVLAPPLLVLIMRVANSKRVMGERVNGLFLNVLGWGTTLIMAAAAIGLLITWSLQ